MIRYSFDTIESTNTQAQLLLKSENNLPKVFSVVANKQTKARGKLGSVWQCGEGNLYESIVVKVGEYFNIEDFGLISLLTSLSVRETLNEILLNRESRAIEKISDLHILSKWPNDILIVGNLISNELQNNNSKDDIMDKNFIPKKIGKNPYGNFVAKISGILLEVDQNKQGDNYLIIGIGVNLLNAPKINNYQTISLFDITSQKISNLIFADMLEDKFFSYLNKFQDNKINIIEKFKENLYLFQQEIKIKIGDSIKTGIFSDMTDLGYLILDNGKTKEIITAGEVFGF